MRKVNTAYSLHDPRKFADIAEAKKELNRLRAVCIRLKKKQSEDISFLLGLSVTSSEWFGTMGYDKPKNQGGKKQFICAEKRIHNGKRVTPCTDKPPHLHIIVEGYGASSCAEHILQSMRKRSPAEKFRKVHLKTAERVATAREYIEAQSTVLHRL